MLLAFLSLNRWLEGKVFPTMLADRRKWLAVVELDR